MRSAEPGPAASPARRLLDVGLLAGAIAVSAVVLFWPTTPGPPLFPYADKIIHALVFATLALTAARVGLPVRALAFALVAYAVGSEVVQHTLLPGRSGDWTDALVDLVGAAAGLLLASRSRSPGG